MSNKSKKARRELLKMQIERGSHDVDKMKKRSQERKDRQKSDDYVKDIRGKWSLKSGKLHQKTKDKPYKEREKIRKEEEKKLKDWALRQKANKGK